jgi:hypothetical protein
MGPFNFDQSTFNLQDAVQALVTLPNVHSVPWLIYNTLFTQMYTFTFPDERYISLYRIYTILPIHPVT